MGAFHLHPTTTSWTGVYTLQDKQTTTPRSAFWFCLFPPLPDNLCLTACIPSAHIPYPPCCITPHTLHPHPHHHHTVAPRHAPTCPTHHHFPCMPSATLNCWRHAVGALPHHCSHSTFNATPGPNYPPTPYRTGPSWCELPTLVHTWMNQLSALPALPPTVPLWDSDIT